MGGAYSEDSELNDNQRSDEESFHLDVVATLIKMCDPSQQVQAKLGDISEVHTMLNRAEAAHQEMILLDPLVKEAKKSVSAFIKNAKELLDQWSLLPEDQRSAINYSLDCNDGIWAQRYETSASHPQATGNIQMHPSKGVEGRLHEMITSLEDSIGVPAKGRSVKSRPLEEFIRIIKRYWETKSLPFSASFDTDINSRLVPLNPASVFCYEAARCVDPKYTTATCSEVMTKIQRRIE